ncbi:MAG TPA: hypothetical protein VG455_09305 [Acidimicrobiales bacterium]|nr:hypothetical protein [Acidimicrobiales bacterium]
MSALIPLIVVWLLVLVPSAVRAHAERRREFIGSFHRQLGALEASSTSASITSAGAHETRAAEPKQGGRRSATARRRAILGGLVLSMVVTLLPLFVLPGKLSLAVHLAVDNCFLVYVGLLVRRRDTRAATKVTARPPVAVAQGGDPLVLAPRVRAAIPA